MEGDSFTEHVLFTYSTKHLSSTDKVKFHYSLKGRNGSQGVIHESEGEHVGSTVIIVPEHKADYIAEFFAHWQVPYASERIMKKPRGDAE